MSQQRFILYVDRMSCANCAGTIAKEISTMSGVVTFKTLPEKRQIDVVLDTARTDPSEVKAAVEKLGFEVRKIETA